MPHLSRLVPRTLLLLALILVPGAIATPAGAAAPGVSLFSFGAGGGPSSPSGDAGDALNSGYNAMGFVRFNIPAFPVDPRVNLLYQKADMENASFAADGLTGGDVYGGGQLETFSVLIEGELSILPLGPVQAYIVAGAGWSNYKVSLEGGPGGAKVDDSASPLALSAGLGVNVSIGPIRAFAEGRLTRFENDDELLAFGSTDLVPVTFGIQF